MDGAASDLWSGDDIALMDLAFSNAGSHLDRGEGAAGWRIRAVVGTFRYGED